MTTITKTTAVTGFTGTIAKAASEAYRFVIRLVVAQRNRRTIMSLGEWNDQMLHDIGLTRADLHSALGTSMLEDPSERLGTLADMRNRIRAARSIS
ncbi:DUF1127 domain-containing protein [Phyllobacterium sp. 21LDTY02-6]|jgi:uncharacterized protein YjiS (DUF1127 family)|uniref:DUF1127 domain-containing protein n=1 Tax=unclassified Phyllobacterium TaxID=2638441 RepID=UPI0020205732|nr:MULTISPECIES: DUF1127 domain-containing protein [unclassified Phyllobacterium]MCO4318702.1 DUF1127 domain-containing protein [Phyllobacterium sp. 21LDTY02-6]MCX8281218.1 DUF1127 domain-containing protein [Phyllobacterium sp. 0TCS1.6C]MCX8294496.1 DUF1127 domain-containing protein [Phyllobacterium sp. 0TCS1.6A]